MAVRGQKEAICLLLDCGESMSRLYDNSNDTLLSLSKTCISNIIRQKIFAESKNEYVLMQFSATTGSHSNSDYRNFRFINMYRSLSLSSFDLLRYVSQINGTDIETNLVDALTESCNALLDLIKGQKFSAVKLALFTDFGDVNSDSIEFFKHLINDKFVANNVQLILICDQTSQINNTIRDKMLKIIDESSNCLCYDINDANKSFEKFESKKVSSAAWYAYLDIGRGDNSVRLPIAGYGKVTEYKRKSGKETVLNSTTADNNDDIIVKNETISDSDDTINQNTNITNKSNATDIEKIVTYRQREDELMREVDKEDVIQAYRYGSTLVPFTVDDKSTFAYKSSEKGFKVIGFTSIHNILPSYRIGDKTMFVISDPRSNVGKYAFQALIRALYETEEVAIVRYAYRNESSPQIGYLFPHTENKDLMLVYIQLPFSEDIRQYRFPSLQAKPQYCPSSEQLGAIDQLINAMDLMSADVDEECDEVCEAFQSEKINNPFLQHWYQCLYNSYLNKDKPTDISPSEQLKYSIDIPSKIRQNAETSLRKVSQLFTLEVLKTKKLKRADLTQGSEASTSQLKKQRLDEMSELPDSSDVKVEKDDFNVYNTLKSELSFSEICDKLEVTISDGLKCSDEEYIDKALDLLESYRLESISHNQPNCFNKFMYEFIKKQFHGTDIWQLVLFREIKVISKLECEGSDLTQEDVDRFSSIEDT